MKFFGKNISDIYIFDFLPALNMSGALVDFCNKHLYTSVETPANPSQFFNALTNIAGKQHAAGIIIQLMGHGDTNRVGFGRDQSFAIGWPEIVMPFMAINKNSGDNLVINTSTMCLSDPLAQLMLDYPAMCHAILYSTATRTNEGIGQNIRIYQACLTTDDTVSVVSKMNDDIYEYGDDLIRPYGYIGH